MRLTWGALASGRMQSAAWNRYHARIMLRWSANEDKERSEWEVKGDDDDEIETCREDVSRLFKLAKHIWPPFARVQAKVCPTPGWRLPQLLTRHIIVAQRPGGDLTLLNANQGQPSGSSCTTRVSSCWDLRYRIV